MTIMKTGVIGKSLKTDEKRVAIHPDHFEMIAPELCDHLVFEEGYGQPFGIEDAELAQKMGRVAPREDILANCDLIILCKPLAADLRQIKRHGVLWGWAHCVQQYEITQAAIDRKLTLITWEGMNRWDKNGQWLSHTFYRNNEIAGYAGVLHAMGLMAIDGEYGPSRKAAVINFGSVGQGAVRALRALGFKEITLYVLQTPDFGCHVPSDIKMVRINSLDNGSVLVGDVPFISELCKMDVVVNGMLQDPSKPLTFFEMHQTRDLKRGSLIVDVSCDEGMGFPFARPTSFAEPMVSIEGISYYAVDHTPAYLWNSASWEISKALLPYLKNVMSGPDGWGKDDTILRAIEVNDGLILNPQILSFQERQAEYPHNRKTAKKNNSG